jgi:hypothetical protein
MAERIGIKGGAQDSSKEADIQPQTNISLSPLHTVSIYENSDLCCETGHLGLQHSSLTNCKWREEYHFLSLPSTVIPSIYTQLYKITAIHEPTDFAAESFFRS